MGKKKSKQKSKTSAKPKNERTLPFLQDMFPNVEKDIVSIIYEENEYDEEKTIQQLEELSLNDGSKSAPLVYDDSSFEDGAFEAPLTETPTTAIPIKPTTNTSEKRQTPPKSLPFISTYEEYQPTSSTNLFGSSTTLSSQFQPTAYSAFTTTSTSTPTISMSKSSSSSTSTATTSSNQINFPAYDGGDAKQFLNSMFPELDSTMIALLYDENGNDVGKTVESLLSIVFMNHGDSEEGEEDDVDNSEEQLLSTENEEGIVDFLEDVNGEEIEDEEVDMESFKIEITKPLPANNEISAVKSDFIVKLNLLAELFPDTPRTLLALELDEHDCDLEKTIASCCRADPEYLRRLSGEKPNADKPTITIVKEERPSGPTAVDSVLKPSWIGAGSSHANLLNNNAATKAKYVKTTPPVSTATSTAKGKGKETAKEKGKGKEPTRVVPKKMDLAAKLKLKQLREKFNFVDSDILEAVFVQSGHKVQATLMCLYDIYPHLREHAPLPANPAYASSPAETSLSRKREKPDAAPATPTQQLPNGEKRKIKRTKPEGENGEDGEGEFVTVSYRKKKSESSNSNSNGTAPNKKVMDSEDIENVYHNYREQAKQSAEMRNFLFREATIAFQAGDGARAKALSQRARDYDEKMKDAHRQACHQIFLDCNARLDTFASIDLHGLHVAEALQVINQLLEIHAQMGESNNKPKKLRVITGQGRHSLHGIAKIKPAVKNFLRSKGYTFVEAEAGVITISLSRI